MKRLILKSNTKSALMVYTAFVVFSLVFSPWEKTAIADDDPNFPFSIDKSRFVRKSNNEPVFLNIIGYQPLEPGQNLDGQMREKRMLDDLRRLSDYQGDAERTDPVVLRVYAGPTAEEPNRIPQFFYDSVRKLGFWIIRDIYVGDDYLDPNALQDANDQIDSVIAEVNDANAFDVIFAWEIGNEFKILDGDVASLTNLICHMRDYIKMRLNEVGDDNDSNLVTWAASTQTDPLWTWKELPVKLDCLDYIGYNVYSYEPERMRDHQPGPTTGTPYQGYLAALKERYPDKPFVITEVGFSDSNLPEPNSVHNQLHPWYPSYRKGALTDEQIAEGLAARYWDARLLHDANDPNIVIAGFAIFEWNDEWHKGESDPNEDDGLPEEHFGLGRFVESLNDSGYQLRYKLQQETIRDLYTLKFDNDVNIIESLVVDDNSISVDANTWVRVVLSDSAAKPVCLRWECSRGYIIGDPNCVADPNNQGEPNSVIFYSGKVGLGPATVTAVAIDANGNADRVSTSINIEITEPNRIEILTSGISTLGEHKFSGKVYNVDLTKYRLVCYLLDWRSLLVPKPTYDMTSIWINKQGYWWSTAMRAPADHIYCWLVPKSCNLPPDDQEFGWSPPCAIAEANTVDMDVNDYKDDDNDLLPDGWEEASFGDVNVNDRYDDFDGDGAKNLEEFLAGTPPNDVMDPNKNDTDNDSLWDNWERHFFGDPNFYDANDDPDGDGLTNSEELLLGLHPVRVAADRDRDRLPDLWEIRWFNNLAQDANDNPDEDCLTNLDEYELGVNPTKHMGDINCDWTVDLNDLDIFKLTWLRGEGEENWDPNCDIFKPNDDFINFLDFAVFAENWLGEL